LFVFIVLLIGHSNRLYPALQPKSPKKYQNKNISLNRLPERG